MHLLLTAFSVHIQGADNMYLGFDTSNYTTSVALYDGKNIFQAKKLLTVKPGEKGLRQSDALFQHTQNIPKLIDDISFNGSISAVAVSTRPRNVEGSYMPCFLAGISAASAVSKFCNAQLFETSHQVGHILSALYSADKLELLSGPFIAFHLSGGTTEALLVKPDKDEIIKAEIISQSLDLKAGQAIDRAGVMLSLDFPCGVELDKLSQKSDKEFNYKPSMKGIDCSLSGIENKANAMLEKYESREDIAKFVLTAVSNTICEMLIRIVDKYGDLPILFSGGVSSNSILRESVNKQFNAYFASPEFSCDNAAGIAIYAFLKDKYDNNYSFTG